MNKEFVTYEIAKELKDLGFDEPCIGSYSNKKTFNFTKGGLMYKTTPCEPEFCIAPLWQQAFRWFRDKHSLIAVPLYIGGDYRYYDILINDDATGEEIEYDQMLIPKYEEAELACLEILIEIVKNRKNEN